MADLPLLSVLVGLCGASACVDLGRDPRLQVKVADDDAGQATGSDGSQNDGPGEAPQGDTRTAALDSSVAAEVGGTYDGGVDAETTPPDASPAPADASLPPAPVLAAPARLVAEWNYQGTLLTWTDVPGAKSYLLRRSETSGGPYRNVGPSVTINEVVDTTQSDDTLYFYVVVAADAAGATGSDSAEVAFRHAANLLANPGFEVGGAVVTNPPGWYTFADPMSQLSNLRTEEGASHSGRFHMVHRPTVDMFTSLYTYQIHHDLPAGMYIVRVWLSATTVAEGDNAIVLKGFGGAGKYIPIASTSGWLEFKLAPFMVSNGSCEIGFVTANHRNSTLQMDDVALYRVSE